MCNQTCVFDVCYVCACVLYDHARAEDQVSVDAPSQRYLFNLAPLKSSTAGVFDFGIPLCCSVSCLRAIFSSSINRRCHLVGVGDNTTTH